MPDAHRPSRPEQGSRAVASDAEPNHGRAEIRELVRADDYVLPAQRWRDPGRNAERVELARRRSSSQALRSLVMEVAARAGINAHIHPHLLRHAFGDHIAKRVGLKNAQALMGHATVATTADMYTVGPTLDDLAASVAGFAFGLTIRAPDVIHRGATQR